MGETRLVGRSSAHQRILSRLDNASKTDVEVLISGPSGVGKELYARYLHDGSSRADQPFVAVNCAAIPISLFENEIFGHVGGAFTGAKDSSRGVVDEAEGGTLLLDEVDALEPSNQVKLLRFLQQREYRRLGEPRVRKANVRIVAATNSDLPSLVRERLFREDLFFRVRVFPVDVPPLRERPEDIEPLLAAYVERYAGLYGVPQIKITGAALLRLETYSWPGNVRELENCVRYLTALRLPRPVEVEDLELVDDAPRSGSASAPPSVPPPVRRDVAGPTLRQAKQGFERRFVIEALRASGGNITHAARNSGKPRRSFFELMRKHGVQLGDFRRE